MGEGEGGEIGAIDMEENIDGLSAVGGRAKSKPGNGNSLQRVKGWEGWSRARSGLKLTVQERTRRMREKSKEIKH